MQLTPPRGVREIAERLERAGFETWCVGGAVRDALLGHSHLDWDLATRATPSEMQALFRRTIPKGIRFGTLGIPDSDGVIHEVTTFRRDVRTDGRHAEVEFGASLDDDLARRDFTINAIAYSPSRDSLYDPFGGRADLDRHVVRAVGTPEERMREDRLRALRALRFAGRFGFAIEPGTWAAITASAPHLGRLSPERVREEIQKSMEQVARPSESFGLWKKSGAFATLVPQLADVTSIDLATLDCLPLPTLTAHAGRRAARLSNRIAALFLPVDAEAAHTTLRALRFSNAEVAWIGALVERWHRLGEELSRHMAEQPLTDAQLRDLASEVTRTAVGAFLRIAAARWAASRAAGDPAPPSDRVSATYRRALLVAFRDPIAVADLAVDGEDLRRLGVAPGPGMGKILRQLLDAVLEDPARNTHDELLSRARRVAGF